MDTTAKPTLNSEDDIEPTVRYEGYTPRIPQEIGGATLQDEARLLGEVPVDTIKAINSPQRGDDEDPEADRDDQNEYDPERVDDSAHTSKKLLGLGIVLLLLLVVSLVLNGLVFPCKLNWCNEVDKSSNATTRYSFETYRFLVPTSYILISFAGAILGLLSATAYAVLLVRKETGEPYMVQLVSYIREGVTVFLVQEYILLGIFVVPMFILIGFGANFATAGCYLFGVVAAALSGWLSTMITGRGNVRTAVATSQSPASGWQISFRSSSTAGLIAHSFSLGGITFSYLVFRDVRALIGFIAGVSTTSMFGQIGGQMFAKAADFVAGISRCFDGFSPLDDPRSSAIIADKVGSNVGEVQGTGMDLFETFVTTIAATAILGSSLPYFYKDPYALCVFNNFHVDKECTGFLSPGVKVSFAAQICRVNELYKSYPSLGVWESNSVFVALPFMIGLVGLLASIVSTLLMWIPNQDRDDGNIGRSTAASLLWGIRQNFIIACILMIVGCAGLCFGFFGGASRFQDFGGTGTGKSLPRHRLNLDDIDKCTPKSLLLENDTSNLPMGEIVDSYYEPTSSLGYSFPKPSSVPWRLYTCTLVGIVVQVITYLFAEHFTGPYSRANDVAFAAKNGEGATLLRGLEVGLLFISVPVFTLVGALILSLYLFGPYGVGITAVTILSTAGFLIALSACGSTSGIAKSIQKMTRSQSRARKMANTVKVAGDTCSGISTLVSIVAAVMASFVLIGTIMEYCGLAPSPIELAGSRDVNPSRHITDADPVAFTDIYVFIAVLMGATIPFFFGAWLMLGVRRTTIVVAIEARRELREVEGIALPSRVIHPDHAACVRSTTQYSMLESVLPCMVIITAPLIVGFGFGQRALIGFLLGAIGSGFVLALTMCSSGRLWSSARKVVEMEDLQPKDTSKRHVQNPIILSHMIGKPMKGLVGPSMNILIKLMTICAAIASPLMKADTEKGWIGLVILLVVGIVTIAFWFLLVARVHAKSKSEDDCSEKYTMPGAEAPQATSPFYEAGPRIEGRRIAPGSQVHKALQAVEDDPLSPNGDPLFLPILEIT